MSGMKEVLRSSSLELLMSDGAVSHSGDLQRRHLLKLMLVPHVILYRPSRNVTNTGFKRRHVLIMS